MNECPVEKGPFQKEITVFHLPTINFQGRYSLWLFQHTFGTHPKQPLPTGYKRDSFHNWRTGDCQGCALGVCYHFLGYS